MSKIEKNLSELKSQTGEDDSPLDTSAQPCQKESYQQRARSKAFSLPLATRLADHAKLVKSPDMEKSYRNSIYCSGVVTQAHGQLSAKYCGNRWCLVCNRIRTARAIEAYTPVIESWLDPYAVVLTLRNVPAEELSATLDMMREKFSSCLRAIRRSHGLDVVAVRKLEITYSIERGDYHPHFHIIIDGEKQAYLLRDLWLRRLGDRAKLKSQNVKPCREGSLKELFKYATKLSTKTKNKDKQPIPIAALHVIFEALRGRRIWQPCGFKLPKEVEESIEGEVIEVDSSRAFKRESENIHWYWDQSVCDWVDEKTGECLSEYVPSKRDLHKLTVIEASLPAG